MIISPPLSNSSTFLTIPAVPARFSDHHSLGIPKHAAADLPAHNNRRQKPRTAPKLEHHARLSVCLCTRVRTSTVVPEESLENVAATEFKRRSWIFSERGRPWNYTRTYYSRVTSGRGEKNKKRDHCQRSQLYGSSKPPTTNNNGNRAGNCSSSSRAAASARGSMRGRRDGPTRTKLRPVQRTRQQPQSARDGGDSKRTTPSPERGPENRKITSNVTSHVLPIPSPIARDIIMSHVPTLGPESLAPPFCHFVCYLTWLP